MRAASSILLGRIELPCEAPPAATPFSSRGFGADAGPDGDSTLRELFARLALPGEIAVESATSDQGSCAIVRRFTAANIGCISAQIERLAAELAAEADQLSSEIDAQRG